jgi:hypothetical protein
MSKVMNTVFQRYALAISPRIVRGDGNAFTNELDQESSEARWVWLMGPLLPLASPGAVFPGDGGGR